MADLYKEDRLRRRWDLLTTIAEDRLSVLRSGGDENVDAPVGAYATTYGFLHARIAAAIAVIENSRLGDKRLADEFRAHLAVRHGDELRILRAEMAEKMHNDMRSRASVSTTGLRHGMRLTVRSGNLVRVDSDRHHAEMLMSSEVTRPTTNPREPVLIEARHIARATESLRRDLRQCGDPEWATRAILFGRHETKLHRHGYDWHADSIPVPPYPVPITLEPPMPWHHGMQGRLSISIPQRLILDQHGPAAEADEVRTFSLTSFDLVHDVPGALRHAVSNASRNVCRTLAYRTKAREHADEIRDRVIKAVAASNGATTIVSYMVEHEQERLTATIVLHGYCPGTYRQKTYEIKTYQQAVKDVIKSLETKIAEQIAIDDRIHEKVGFLPISPDRAVDLGLYTIDRPLLKLLTKSDAAALIDHAIRNDGKLPDDAAAALGMDVAIHIDRGRIKGTFDLSPTVEWRGGRIKLHNATLPAAIRNALVSMPVSALAVHPLLDEAMTIASFQEMTQDGRTDTYVRFKDGAVSALDAA